MRTANQNRRRGQIRNRFSLEVLDEEALVEEGSADVTEASEVSGEVTEASAGVLAVKVVALAEGDLDSSDEKRKKKENIFL